jgi:hypothetical protein
VNGFVLLAALSGCPSEQPKPPGDDRLLAKLKAEKEREQREGPMVAPTAPVEKPKDEPVNPLAEFAAKGTKKRELRLPTKTLLNLSNASLRLNGLTASHTVGESPSVTTDDLFLMLSFNATSAAPTTVDLSSAHLELGTRSFSHARDAQAASRVKAVANVTSGGSAVVVYFETPPDALTQGLTLVVPDGAGEQRLELQ